jgi:hypothetical protein
MVRWLLLVALGSGYRLQVDMMGGESVRRVRTALRHRMDREGVRELTSDIPYARAVRARNR